MHSAYLRWSELGKIAHQNRQFNPDKPSRVWCGDVTYICTGKRWSYLAVVMDLFGRKPVGWAMSLSPDSELTSAALKMAYACRGRPKGVMLHSDQGSHCTSRRFRQTLWQCQLMVITHLPRQSIT